MIVTVILDHFNESWLLARVLVLQQPTALKVILWQILFFADRLLLHLLLQLGNFPLIIVLICSQLINKTFVVKYFFIFLFQLHLQVLFLIPLCYLICFEWWFWCNLYFLQLNLQTIDLLFELVNDFIRSWYFSHQFLNVKLQIVILIA